MIYVHSSESMYELADGEAALVCCSPPYGVDMPYERGVTAEQHLAGMRAVFTECYRVTMTGGRLAINIANTGRKPYVTLTTDIDLMLRDIGWLCRAIVIWQKGDAPNMTSWGTWRSHRNPVVRDSNEFLLLYCKETFDLRIDGESGISADEFLAATNSIWRIPPASATRIGHPAPYPIALPRRVIELLTPQGALVVDPYLGSGSTAIAAEQTNRRWAGYELNPTYADLARRRIEAHRMGQLDLWDEHIAPEPGPWPLAHWSPLAQVVAA